MAVYSVTGPDGTRYRVEGPEGATKEQLVGIVQAKLQQGAGPSEEDRELDDRIARLKAELEEERKPKPTIGGYVKEAFKGIPAGAVNLLESAGTGISALLPDEAEKTARGYISRAAEAARAPFEAAPGYEDSVVRKLSEGVGSTAPFFAFGPLGAAGRAGIAALGAGAGAGEARVRAEQAGATAEERGSATGLGTAIGLAELLAPFGADKVVGRIRRALAAGGIEGAQEAATEMAQNAVAQGIYNPNQEILAGTGEAGAYGAGVGALVQALLDTALPGRARGAQPSAKPTSKTAETEQRPEFELTSPTPADLQPVEPPRPEFELTAPEQAEQLELDLQPRREEPPAGQEELDLQPRDEEVTRRDRQAALEETFAEPDLLGEFAGRQEPEQPRPEFELTAPEQAEQLELDLQPRRKEPPAGQEELDLQPRDEKAPKEDKKEAARVALEQMKKKSQASKTEPSVEEPAALKAEEPAALKAEEPAALKAEEPTAPVDLANIPAQVAPSVQTLPTVEPSAPPAGFVPRSETQAPAKTEKLDVTKPQGEVKPSEEVTVDTTLAPEETAAVDFISSIDKGGVPLNTARVNKIAQDLGLEVSKASKPEETIGRIREAVGRIQKPAAPKTEAKKPVEAKKPETEAKKPETEAKKPETEAKKPETEAKKPETEAKKPETEAKKPETEAKKPAAKPAAKKPEPEAKKAKEEVEDEVKAEETKEEVEAEEAGNAEWQALATKPVKDFYGTVSTEFKSLPGGKSEVGEDTDKSKIGGLMRANERTLSKDAKAARTYFLKVPRTVDALRLVAYDEVYQTDRFRQEGESNQEAAFFQGLNGANARLAKKWIENNLSPKVVTKLGKFIIEYEIEKILDEETLVEKLRSLGTKPNKVDDTINDYIAANKIDAVTELRETFGKRLELGVEAVIAANPLHPVVVARLGSGDLLSSLRLLAASSQGNISKIASKLAENLTTTKVEVKKGLKNEEGKPISGLFDPQTNTVQLDSDLGMNAHTLLHEVTHALTSETLDNKSHPVTKQLDTLYNDVKDSLDTYYGSQSLDEFVAEAFTNPEFQAKLQAINPKGQPITAWQRFTHTIKNMLRRLIGLDSKPLESAADRADVLIEAILFPSPETRNAGTLYQVAMNRQGDTVLDRLGKFAEKLPLLNQERVDKIHEIITSLTPGSARAGMLKVLPLHAFVEVAEKYVPGVTRFKTLLDEKKGAEQKRYEGVEATVKYVSDWAGKNPSLVDSLNNVVYTSTTMQVDPSKPASEYKDDKLKVYNELQSDWRKLGKDGQAVYKLMRNTYKKMYNDTRQVIEGRIDAMGLDQASSSKLKKDIYQKLLNSGTIEPYFPLTRAGDYRLVYHAFSPRSNTTELFVEHFETPRARDRAIEELKQDKDVKQDTIQKFTSLEKFDYKSAPPTSFVSSMLKSLEASKINASAQQKQKIDQSIEETMRMFLDLLPETSFAQSFRRRKNKGMGVLGFEHDAIGALKTKGYSLARQLSNIEYGAKFDTFMNKVREDFKAKGNPEDAKPYIEELDTRVKFARSPNVPDWAKVATSFGFNMTLGFNVSSALVNLSQIPLVVVPYLASRHGLVNTTAAVGRATRIFMTSGTTREMETLVSGKKVTTRSMPSIDNIDFKKNPELSYLETLVNEASRMGKLNRSMTQDILEFDEKDTLMNKVNAASGWVFHQGERMNRQVSLIAAYELNLKALKKDGKTGKAAEVEAAQKALYDVELTNGGTFAEAAPSIAQNPIGKIIFMYKNYGVSMYYMLFKGTRDALAAQDPEVRKAARKQIAGIYASAALMAGARGLPMFGVAAMIYNMFADDDEDDFDTAARKWLGETLYGGLLNEATGLEIGGRIGLSDLLFRDTTVKDQESVILSMMEQMGGPVFGVVSRMERGLSLIGDGYVARGVEQMLPSAMGNALKSIRYSTEGTQTLRGDPITGEVGPWNVAAQAFGFAPADYIRKMEENSAVKKLDKAISTEKTKLLRRYYMAMRQGDGDELAEVTDDMQDYNSRHPGNAITGDTIKKSMAQHMKTSATMYHGITIGKKNWNEIMQNLAEYERDIED